MLKSASFKIKGMQRDLSVSAFNPEYAYENKNIRIMPTTENTLLSIINEKGNKLAYIEGIGEELQGIPIGQSVLDDELIIFTAKNSDNSEVPDIIPTIYYASTIIGEELDANINNFNDKIYKLWFDNNVLKGQILYEGNLGFNYKYPIETISFYENNDIKKVYWTDGLNQPRVINIAATSEIINKWKDTSFDFTVKLNLNEVVTIKKDIISEGVFAPGVIQYAFTYFNKYGQESNIFYTSPLYYTSYNNRGASSEDTVGNSFNITVDYVDTSFDYVRIYSIQRTSIDSVPEVKRVIDISIPEGLSEYLVDSYNRYANIDHVSVYDKSQNNYIPLSSITPNSTSTNYKSWIFNGNNYSKIKFYNTDTYLSILPTNSITLSISDGNKLNITSNQLKNDILLYSAERKKINYIDKGTSGDIIDPVELLYVGGEEVIFGTMTQKDNTLFLGDVTLKRKVIDSEIKDYFKGKNPMFIFSSSTNLNSPNPTGYYPYENQLKFNSSKIKTFKYLETYRLGVQFQHYTGKWSEPVWVNDVRNTIHIETSYISKGKIYLPIASLNFNDINIINKLIDLGYTKVRPVIVYPSLTDRECICQGILCPTVYNVNDRYNNSPFAQASWFTRANAPFDEYRALNYNLSSPSQGKGTDWYDRENRPPYYSIDSRIGVMSNSNRILNVNNESILMDIVNKGAWAEFRHDYPIPSNNKRNAEIQCIWNPPFNPYIDNSMSDSDVIRWVSKNAENFYIDQSIVTLHSPDIEFDDNIKNINTEGLKLRIVGYVPLTSFIGDIDIQTSTPANNYIGEEGKVSNEIAPGFYKESISAENISRFGWRGLLSGAFWFDEISDPKNKVYQNTNHYDTGFVVYPFHRNGSLNNKKYNTDGYKSAMLDKKKLSNLRFSFNSYYFDNNKIWNAYVKDSITSTGISGIAIFDSNEVSLVKIPAPENSGLSDINYYGNIDKVISVPRVDYKKEGYPIITTGIQNSEVDNHKLFYGNYIQVDKTYTDSTTGIDPVIMKYKSTPHAVMALNYGLNNVKRILPTLRDGNTSLTNTEYWAINNVAVNITDLENKRMFWEKTKVATRIFQETLNIPIQTQINGSYSGCGPEYGWLWLGEIYNDNVQNRFGGQTEEAFENNQWLPCGESVSFVDNNGAGIAVTINWIEGDTYYQRYDHLKTYPFTLEDQNAITDIVSFMCETRVNIDGRYDKNRGQLSNFTMTPTNFNLINDVYSQKNNFFNYRALNKNKLNLDNFHNLVTWTKTKTVGELVDSWTNINLLNTLDFDGDKGIIRALRRFNNDIITFQDKGVSQILYNENIMLTTTKGTPVEISNSGKVTKKVYLTDKIGCTNKWSICESQYGIYFIDDITKGIFLFNGKIENLSDKLGFHSWINSKLDNINIWNPVDFKGFVTYRDKINGDIFFISKDECLAFSESLGQFTSFYSYENTPYFINLKDRGIAINTTFNNPMYNIWLHNEGDYNMYFNKYQPFYTTIIANPDMPRDKIFNNIEFRADSWNDNTLLNTTFDTLTTWNEYQKGITTLTNVLGKPSPLKKKFRIWRTNIPRDISNNMDRMRNPWLYIKLSMENENINKTLLHDMIVYYYE